MQKALRTTSPFQCQGERQFVTIDDTCQTLRRRNHLTAAVLDELVCSVTPCGCSIDQITASPSGQWLITLRHSGQGEWGYDVLRTCPLARESGVAEERGYAFELPAFNNDETWMVGGFGMNWLGGWWSPCGFNNEQPASGGEVHFGFIFVHHFPSHRVTRHELRIQLPKGWIPEEPCGEVYWATDIGPTADGITLTLFDVPITIPSPLTDVIVLPTPHPGRGRLL